MTPSSSKKGGRDGIKPVSRACLECRSRHLKCDGTEPTCLRCQKLGKECQFVKSNRGGSRKKGVSTKKQKIAAADKTDTGHFGNDIDNFVLPCVKNGHKELTHSTVCDKQCLKPENFNKAPACLAGHTADNGVEYYPKFNASRDTRGVDLIFDPKYLTTPEKYYITPTLVKNLNADSIINTYYAHFHSTHPFMPQRHEIAEYLDSIPHKYDILLAMKLMADGQATTIYSKDVETVNYLVNNILGYTRQVGKDIVSLQTVLLLAMVTHISSLHDLSTSLRRAVVDLGLELNLNSIDKDRLPPVFMDVNGFVTECQAAATGTASMSTPSETDQIDPISNLLASPRTANIPRKFLEDTARRTFWELYFFDTLSGTASGNSTSILASRKVLTFYPTGIPLSVFDFKSRAECCKLVNDAIKLNVAIQEKKEVHTHLLHMKAAIGNWDLRIENPDAYNSPYLVNSSGFVNEGVQQSVILVNYAKIFMHRPFSYLWRPDVSRHPRYTGEDDVDDVSANEELPESEKQGVNSSKIIETRKTIDSASSVVKLLLDTNPAQILHRTPFFACSLAFSCLVHLSAYSWVESSLLALDDTSREVSTIKDSISQDELETYIEYIKLELGGIFQISRHWALSSKLIQHIKDTLMKVSPKLYRKVQTSIPGSVTPQPMEVKVDNSEPPPPPSPRHQSPIKTEPVEASFGNANFRTNTDEIYSTIPSEPVTATSSNSNLNLGEIDFNVIFDDNRLGSLSPSSDTGCDWVDKHVFEFEDFLLN